MLLFMSLLGCRLNIVEMSGEFRLWQDLPDEDPSEFILEFYSIPDEDFSLTEEQRERMCSRNSICSMVEFVEVDEIEEGYDKNLDVPAPKTTIFVSYPSALFSIYEYQAVYWNTNAEDLGGNMNVPNPTLIGKSGATSDFDCLISKEEQTSACELSRDSDSHSWSQSLWIEWE